jgi:hypothetical protein
MGESTIRRSVASNSGSRSSAPIHVEAHALIALRTIVKSPDPHSHDSLIEQTRVELRLGLVELAA